MACSYYGKGLWGVDAPIPDAISPVQLLAPGAIIGKQCAELLGLLLEKGFSSRDILGDLRVRHDRRTRPPRALGYQMQPSVEVLIGHPTSAYYQMDLQDALEHIGVFPTPTFKC